LVRAELPSVTSIFETFRVGAGPSSSHSLGPQRAAQLFLRRLPQPPARVRATLMGSLAATGRGHLTDKTIARALGRIPCDIVWDPDTPVTRHPNTLRFDALDAGGSVSASWTVYSVGGGALADDDGPLQTGAATYPFRTIGEILAHCESGGLTFWHVVEQHEADVWPRLEEVWRIMRESVERGLKSAQVLLPGSLKLARRAHTTHLRATSLQSPHRDMALLSAYALAVAEENANGGTIVTAPSCGPAGVVPGLLYYHETQKSAPREEILRALATAGLFGSVIRANASVSGAEVGCQGEIGSASSMAAAAGAQLLGGTLRQIEYAAEMGMEHHLGLTCDPVEGYVQIPCIERNMTACLRAFECASFALLTDGRHLVTFDEVIEVMYRTGKDLQSRYRETAAGGLAEIWRRRVKRPTPAVPAPSAADLRNRCD
jgi:L-serine dehydratase